MSVDADGDFVLLDTRLAVIRVNCLHLGHLLHESHFVVRDLAHLVSNDGSCHLLHFKHFDCLDVGQDSFSIQRLVVCSHKLAAFGQLNGSSCCGNGSFVLRITGMDFACRVEKFGFDAEDLDQSESGSLLDLSLSLEHFLKHLRVSLLVVSSDHSTSLSPGLQINAFRESDM